MDSQTVQGSLKETEACIRKLKLQRRPVYLLIDAVGVTGQSSGARSQAKALGNMGIDKLAIVNRSRALGMVIQYLLRSSGTARYAGVFRSEQIAKGWLLNESQTALRHDNTTRLIVAAAVALIAGAGLAGWAVDNEVLKSLVPSLKPINPMVAVTLMLHAVVLACIVHARRRLGKRAYIVGGVAVYSILFGWTVLVQTALDSSFRWDALLFGNDFGAGMMSGHASPRAAVALMLLGVMELSVLSGQTRRWQQYSFNIASGLVFLMAFVSIVGYGFGLPVLSSTLGTTLPMPLNTALCLLLINFALQTVAVQLPWFDRAWQGFIKYSQPIILGTVIVLLTGVAWQQSIGNYQQARPDAAYGELQRTSDNISDRMTAYVSTLRGYRSFFESSQSVSVGEFQTFHRSSQLEKYYPGINAVSFARYLQAGEKPGFVAAMRAQASGEFPRLANYTIFPATNQPVAYPVMYVQPVGNTSNYGFDLGSNEERRTTLERARDTNDVAATGTIDLNASRADNSLPKRPGFFITIPVYKAEGNAALPSLSTEAQRRGATYGFVNAIFENSRLFGDVFKNTSNNDVQYVITNARTGEAVYTHNPSNSSVDKKDPYTSTLPVAGQVWRITLYVAPHFGESGIARHFPTIMLVGGGLVTVLGVALSVGQVRRKEQALALASDMTQDLNRERDAAITVQQKDEAILSSIGDAVFAIDNDGRIILFNHAAEVVTGRKESEALGEPYKSLFQFRSSKDNTVVDQFVRTALSGKPAKMGDDTLLVRQDGSTVPVADSAAPIINSQGDVEGAVVVFRDVTQEKELERLKNEFVSMASHELRTPMGAIRAFVSMILAGDFGPVNKNLVEPLTDIRTSTLRLVDLVNDLLNVARIEAGRMKFNLLDSDIGGTLQRVVDTLGPLAKEKGVHLAYTGKKLPFAQADEGKIEQVLTNLVGNALKFTDAGSIVLHARQDDRLIEVTVTDTGTGISAADRQKLFGKFEQVSSAQAGRPAGTGLGLYISREMIRKMGGELWIKESEVGKGTVFAFTLPVAGTPLAKRVKIDRARELKMHQDAA